MDLTHGFAGWSTRYFKAWLSMLGWRSIEIRHMAWAGLLTVSITRDMDTQYRTLDPP